MNFIEPSTLVVIEALIIIAIAVIMCTIAITFKIRTSRLSDATAFENIRALRVQEERRLNELQEKIRDHDRLAAEVSVQQERLDSIKLELANLEAARREIEETKGMAAEAAAECALRRQELDEIDVQVENRKTELRELEASLSPQRIAELEKARDALQVEMEALQAELPKLRIERDAALQRIEEARSAEARKADLEFKIESLKNEIAQLTKSHGDLRQEEEGLRATRGEHNRISEQIVSLEARRAALEVEVSEFEKRQDKRGEADDDEGDLTNDLQILPACLAAPARILGKQVAEYDALGEVQAYLKGHGLDYSLRTVRAFHTCLKINDNAQITVLAGVSGTGKSLLPRRYAEAMGIHFHQLAVEPRWDSPQDLLGFYNYIEKKYRATDLARLLVRMDPYGHVPLDDAGEDRRDHVALVLLDEMNLARVEYYFSEFLSRLEVRPRYSDDLNEDQCKDALIPIDIRGLDKRLALFPSHNVLFAGTMNDDESTQSLSDKVLDRGNILQFAAPNQFATGLVDEAPLPANAALSFKRWRGWVKRTDALGPNRDVADSMISKLADIMEGCGRPFGHRLRDSILVYAANYPKELNGAFDIKVPLADQIEFRILPKLRGLEIEPHKESLDQLQRLIRSDLGDQQLAERLTDLLDKQEKGTGLFVWRGLTRPN